VLLSGREVGPRDRGPRRVLDARAHYACAECETGLSRALGQVSAASRSVFTRAGHRGSRSRRPTGGPGAQDPRIPPPG